MVITKGLAKLEHPDGYWPLIIFLFAGGIYIAIVTFFHERLYRHAGRVEASIYAIECLVMVAMMSIFISEGRTAIPYVTGAAAVGFAIATIVRLTVGPRSHDAEIDTALSSPEPAVAVPEPEP